MKSSKLKKLFLVLVLTVSLFATNVYADDYADDIYAGDYSMKEMLENYNVITFGKKELDANMPTNNFAKGDAKLFHVNSQVLINGNMNVSRFDLKINDPNLKSFAKAYSKLGQYSSAYGFYSCGYEHNSDLNYSCNLNATTIPEYLYSDISVNIAACWRYNCPYTNAYTTIGTYMNFDRLYESIQTEQNKMKKGRLITPENGVAHIGIGGEYYIEDINEVNSIVFDNFGENENNLTVITINNEGSINFPKIYESADNGEKALVSTNDYYGMTRPNSDYADYFVLEKYHGNIIWNIPNATYIELPSAPFIGHLVAAKADVKGPELHYAGSFVVNSLHLAGSSEAHYYPLQVTEIPEKINMEPVKVLSQSTSSFGTIKLKNQANPEKIEEGMVVEFEIEPEKDFFVKDVKVEDQGGNDIQTRKVEENEYEFTMPATDVTINPTYEEKNIANIITNPETGSKLTLVIVVLTIVLGIGLLVYKKKGTKVKI